MVEEPIAASVEPGCAPWRTAAFLERHYPWCALALLLAMALARLIAAVLDSQVVDESYHLTAGYTFLKTGALNHETEHPPLAQALLSLPLLLLHLRAPLPAGPQYPEWQRELHFLYRNRAPAGQILLTARCLHILITLLLGAIVAWWTRRISARRLRWPRSRCSPSTPTSWLTDTTPPRTLPPPWAFLRPA